MYTFVGFSSPHKSIVPYLILLFMEFYRKKLYEGMKAKKKWHKKCCKENRIIPHITK